MPVRVSGLHDAKSPQARCMKIQPSKTAFWWDDYPMTYFQLTFLHLTTVLPASVIGSILMLRRKGTRSHRLWGKVFLLMMLFTAIITLFMPAAVGPRWLGHFGVSHLFCIAVFISVPRAYFAARRGNIRAHRANMIGLYVGAIHIAGVFTFTPGRMMHGLVMHGKLEAPSTR